VNFSVYLLSGLSYRGKPTCRSRVLTSAKFPPATPAKAKNLNSWRREVTLTCWFKIMKTLIISSEHLHLALVIRRALLQLQEQWRILELDEVVDVLKPCIHQLGLAFEGVVAVSDVLSHDFLLTGLIVARKQFDKLVLDVLDKIQLCVTIAAHYEHGKVGVRFLYALV